MPSLDMHALDTADPAVAEQARAQLTSFTALLQSLTQVGGAPGTEEATASSSGGPPLAAEASQASSGSGPLLPPSVLVPPVGTSGAAGATFRELLLHRHIPSQLAAYLLDAFTRPDIDALWPGGVSDTSGLTPPSTMRSSRYARRTVDTMFSAGSSLAGTPQARADVAAEAAAGGGGDGGGDLATTPRSHSLTSRQLQQHSPGPRTTPQGSVPRSLAAGSAGATPSSAGAGAAVLPAELSAWCVPLGSSAWKAALDKPGVLHALQLLLSMAAGHEPTAQQIVSAPPPIVPDISSPLHTPREADTSTSGALSPGRGAYGLLAGASASASGVMSSPLLHLLHLMEGVAGGAVIAPLAESLLDTLAAASPTTQGQPSSQPAGSSSGAPAPATTSVAAAVASIRDATKARMRELAQRRRQAMLTSMGMSPSRPSEGQAASVPGAGAEGRSGTVTPLEGTTPTGVRMQQGGRAGSLTWSPGDLGSTPGTGAPTPPGPGEGPSGVMAAGSVQVGFQVGGEAASSGAGAGEDATPGGAAAGAAATPPPLGLLPASSPGGTPSPAPGTTPRTPGGPPSARGGPLSSLVLSPHSPAGSQLAAELAALEAEEEEGEEVGGEERCMVCREGYRLRPRELLCAYVYCKALHIPTVSTSSASSGSGSTSAAAAALEAALSTPGGHPALFMPPGSPCAAVYSTVTHFNLIHASCHAAARSADASLRAPKREWDGATLRNGDVSCHAAMLLDVSCCATGASGSSRCLQKYVDGIAMIAWPWDVGWLSRIAPPPPCRFAATTCCPSWLGQSQTPHMRLPLQVTGTSCSSWHLLCHTLPSCSPAPPRLPLLPQPQGAPW
jgi:hypothetical protein